MHSFQTLTIVFSLTFVSSVTALQAMEQGFESRRLSLSERLDNVFDAQEWQDRKILLSQAGFLDPDILEITFERDMSAECDDDKKGVVTLSFDHDVKTIVYIKEFRLGKLLRGEGITDAFLSELVSFVQSQGDDEELSIGLKAGNVSYGDIGAYFWTRYGFDFADEDAKERTHADFDKWLHAPVAIERGHSWELCAYGEDKGRCFLKMPGCSWPGVLYPNQKQSPGMLVFSARVK